MRDKFDVAFANDDTDADRHWHRTRSNGQMNLNHTTSLRRSPICSRTARNGGDSAVGKTIVSSAIIDRVKGNRQAVENPVRFKWFVERPQRRFCSDLPARKAPARRS
jgi:phosphoglucomutase